MFSKTFDDRTSLFLRYAEFYERGYERLIGVGSGIKYGQ
jgi:hypothetical protein